jgi:hypothetical protein
MCGIAAVIDSEHPEILDDMLARLSHRGTDDNGIAQVGPGSAIGINRLSIVDVAGGGQPLSSTLGNSVVCNGEIYNHEAIRARFAADYQFAGRSDVEVILPLYERRGADCVGHLDGMFAFVLYDRSRGTFLAARDRYGIKPLYYVRDGDSWYFASEAKAFLGSDLPVERVQTLPPGCLITPDGISRWYRLDEDQRVRVPNPALLRAILDASVDNLLPHDIVWRMKLAFDHGSGILGLIGSVEDEITDAELADAQHVEFPDAGIRSKLGLFLFRLWRQRFGELGGDHRFELFGCYPTLQAALDARTNDSWGTGEPEHDLDLLDIATGATSGTVSSSKAAR